MAFSDLDTATLQKLAALPDGSPEQATFIQALDNHSLRAIASSEPIGAQWAEHDYPINKDSALTKQLFTLESNPLELLAEPYRFGRSIRAALQPRPGQSPLTAFSEAELAQHPPAPPKFSPGTLNILGQTFGRADAALRSGLRANTDLPPVLDASLVKRVQAGDMSALQEADEYQQKHVAEEMQQGLIAPREAPNASFLQNIPGEGQRDIGMPELFARYFADQLTSTGNMAIGAAHGPVVKTVGPRLAAAYDLNVKPYVTGVGRALKNTMWPKAAALDEMSVSAVPADFDIDKLQGRAAPAPAPAPAEFTPWSDLANKEPVSQQIGAPFQPWDEIGQDPQQNVNALDQWMQRPGAPEFKELPGGQLDFLSGGGEGQLGYSPFNVPEREGPIQLGQRGASPKQMEFDFSKRAPWAQEPARGLAADKKAALEKLLDERAAQQAAAAQPKAAGKSPVDAAFGLSPVEDDYSAGIGGLWDMVSRSVPEGSAAWERMVGYFNAADEHLAAGRGSEAFNELDRAQKLIKDPVARGAYRDELGNIEGMLADEAPHPLLGPEPPVKINVKKALSNMDDPDFSSLSMSDILRQAGSEASAFKAVMSPSALDDLGAVVKGVRIKSRGLGSMGGNMDVSLTPEAKEALDRLLQQHGPALLEHISQSSRSIPGAIKEYFPGASDAVVQAIEAALRPQLRAGVMQYRKMPDGTQDAAKEAIAAKPELGQPTKSISVEEQMKRGMADPGTAKLVQMMVDYADKAAAAGRLPEIELARGLADDMRAGIPASDALNARIDTLRAANGVRTFSGRLQNSFKVALEESGDLTVKVGRWIEEAKSRGELTPEQAAQVQPLIDAANRVGEQRVASWLAKIHEYGVNSMLSAVITIDRNIFGNYFSYVLAPLERATIGALNIPARAVNRGINAVRGMAGKAPKDLFKNTDVTVRGAIPLTQKLITETPNSLKRAGQYLLHGDAERIDAAYQKKLDALQARTDLTPARRAELTQRVEASRAKFKSETGEEASRLKDLGMTPRQAIGGVAGDVINLPTRGVIALDQGPSLPMEKGLTAARQFDKLVKAGAKIDWANLGEQLKAVKLTPEEAADITGEMLDYMAKRPLSEFMQELTRPLKPTSLAGYVAQNLVGMFVRTTMSLFKFSMDRTQMGMLFKVLPEAIQNARSGAANGIIDMKSVGKCVFGMTATAYLYQEAKKKGWQFYLGSFTPGERANRVQAKLPQGVFAVDGQGHIHDFSNSYPLTFFVGLLASEDQASRANELQRGPMRAVKAQMIGHLQTALGASPVSGIQDLVKAAQDQEQWGQSVHAPGERSPVEKYLANQVVSRLVPNIINEANRTYFDKTQRNPQSFVQDVENRIPGLSARVRPQVNWMGQEQPKTPIYTPFRSVGGYDVQADPVVQEVNRLGLNLTPAPASVKGIPTTIEDRDNMKKAWGPTAYNVMSQVVNSPDYERMSDYARMEALQSIYSNITSIGPKMFEANMLADMVQTPGGLEHFLRLLTKGRALELNTAYGSEVMPFAGQGAVE